MVFLFCQPGLNNSNTIDFLIKKLIIKSLKLKKHNIISINSLNKNKKENQVKLKRLNLFFPKISIIVNSIIFFFKLKQTTNNNKISHIFFDGYTFFDFLFFSFLKKIKIKIIIFLRIPYDKIFGLGFLFNYSINKLKKFSNVIFVTDTKNLKIHFKKNFEIDCKIVPIPSKINTFQRLKKINFKNLNILFPGKSRVEKGTKLIIKMFHEINMDYDVKLSFQYNKKLYEELANKKGLLLNILDNNLSYENYIKSIKNSDVLILPYVHPTYKLRSSGIFIEAIKLNKIIVVNKNTWMSDVLLSNNLNELILNDWNFKNLIKKFDMVIRNLVK